MRRALIICVLAGLLTVTGCTTSTNLALVPEQKSATKAAPETRARVHTELAALYYQQSSYKVALNELATAIKIDLTYAPVHGMLGLVYMQLGENAAANSNFQQAIALAPADTDLRNNYGLFLCNTGQTQAGLKQLEQAWKNPLYGTPSRALTNASQCAAGAGDQAQASLYRQQAARYGVEPSVCAAVPANATNSQ